ncbi:hypothetical protein OG21DRAFT_1510142 [Imleria badia]|nr:hypothetical protein OG21DRAFT_1510142 [Imleria badia]
MTLHDALIIHTFQSRTFSLERDASQLDVEPTNLKQPTKSKQNGNPLTTAHIYIPLHAIIPEGLRMSTAGTRHNSSGSCTSSICAERIPLPVASYKPPYVSSDVDDGDIWEASVSPARRRHDATEKRHPRGNRGEKHRDEHLKKKKRYRS